MAASPQLHVIAEYFVFDFRADLEQSGQELLDFLVFLEFEAILLNDLDFFIPDFSDDSFLDGTQEL
eukprot:CAMPEP_0197007574 /NCGR_PEP_ID=MMETSP1380-20130617/41359_1 /TAXON_ID=5936 /ORGANISM="Euplotes crassus, Strain CT5" /LENGTH=65 /DNA_ID=CAMNT_0042427755 /DNA_START=563 /DNA_END=760 /DNA_ORIENTATION=-